jgi:heme a synthase
VLSRLIALVWQPTPKSLRGWALASVISNAVIISTGAAVRLSSSGLGCPDWPTCTKSSVVAAHSVGQTTLNTWIEFSNRLLTYPLVAIAGLTFIAFLRYYQTSGRTRKDLVWLSAILPLGVIAQAVVGGILVLTKLNPALDAAHFLLSTAIILTSAVVLHARASALAVAAAGSPGPPPVRADLRVLAGLFTAVTAVMLAAGTVVTGTGPLAGTTLDEHGHRTTVPRFHFSLESVTQLHADIGWFIGALAVALVIGLRFAGGSPRTVRLGWIVLVGLGVQGVIGYVQYFNHLPAGLVWVHVASAVTVWIFVLQLCLSTGTGLGRSAGPAARADEPPVDEPRADEQAPGESVAAPPPIRTAILRPYAGGAPHRRVRVITPGQPRCPGARGTRGR